jgi:hypothetical protein
MKRYAWLIFWAFSALALALMMRDDLSRYIRLAHDGVPTTARVTGANCNDHGSVYYSYTWQGTTYHRGDIAGEICGSARSGDPIRIWILPSDAHVESMSEPKSGLLNDLLFLFLSTGLLTLGLNAAIRGSNRARLLDHL